MKKIISLCIVFSVAVLFSACRKKTDTYQPEPTLTPAPIPPVPDAGGIVGVFGAGSPAGIVAKIMLPSGGAPLIATPETNGAFKFSNIPPVEYTLIFEANNTNIQGITIKTRVKPNEIADIGTLVFTSNLLTGNTGSSTITGTINFAKASNIITAMNTRTNVGYNATIDANGGFKFSNLPSGEYNINAISASGYTIKDNKTITVDLPSGKTVDCGGFVFYDNADASSPYFISYDIDGTTETRGKTTVATYNGKEFNLQSYTTGTQQSGVGVMQMVVLTKLEISLENITAPGTYVCNGTNSFIRYSWRQPNPFSSTPLHIWSTTGSGGTGTVIITSINATNRTLSGTFTATTVAENTIATGTRVIANGKFANYKY